jgi:hypothetical protein
MLSIRGTDFIACSAEHARKCLKVEYLGQIEYDFQKSRVTGPWDHMVSISAKKVKKMFHACVPLKFKNSNSGSLSLHTLVCTLKSPRCEG